MALNSAAVLVPLKGRLPVSASYRMTPMDHMSTEGPSYSRPVVISGAVNSGVPHCRGMARGVGAA